MVDGLNESLHRPDEESDRKGIPLQKSFQKVDVLAVTFFPRSLLDGSEEKELTCCTPSSSTNPHTFAICCRRKFKIGPPASKENSVPQGYFQELPVVGEGGKRIEVKLSLSCIEGFFLVQPPEL